MDRSREEVTGLLQRVSNLVELGRVVGDYIDRQSGDEPRLIWDRSTRDRYGDPGSPVTTLNAWGRSVVRVHDETILLAHFATFAGKPAQASP